MELRTATTDEQRATCEALIAQLSAIRANMVRQAEAAADLLAGLHPRHRASGRNSVHYLTFRRHDLAHLPAPRPRGPPVRSRAGPDLVALRERLAPLGERAPALVLKVETLPAMLLKAMRGPRCGETIARGDLAVACGFERLAEVQEGVAEVQEGVAEVQEEVLWVCEAAHVPVVVPVVWATQVLESLAKEGLPSRAEVTDAAMGHRAECVMLNKGPHVVKAVQAPDDILRTTS